MRQIVEIEALRPDIPMADYLAMDAVSNSDLKAFRRSPASYFHHRDHTFPSTKAMQFGTATHACVLEHDTFAARVGRLPADFNGRTKAGKELKAQMQGEYEVVLTSDEYASVEEIRASIMRNPAARALIEAHGPIESTVTVKDPITDMMLRCRPDKLCTSMHTLIDLKKTVRTSTSGFLRQAFDLKYFQQLSYYRMQIRELARRGLVAFDAPDIAALLVVTDSSPYENTVIPIEAAILDVEEVNIREALDRLANAVHSGVYPGWDHITEPQYATWIREEYGI